MALQSRLNKLVAFIALAPLSIPGPMQSAIAKEPVRSRLVTKTQANEPKPIDVVLQPGNIIAGEALSADGVLGEFAAEVPRGGVYVVSSSAGALLVRTWTATAAPPNSLYRVAITPQTTVIRAQNSDGGFNPLLGLLLAGGIAAAIAVPIALNNSGGNDSPKNTTRTNPGDNGNNIPQSP